MISIMEGNNMNLDFLDNGLSLEYNEDADTSVEISEFLKYCKSIKKRPEQLTGKELKAFYEKVGANNDG